VQSLINLSFAEYLGVRSQSPTGGPDQPMCRSAEEHIKGFFSLYLVTPVAAWNRTQ
jgi:hypothetical protein